MKLSKAILGIFIIASIMLMTSCADDYLITSSMVNEVIDSNDKEMCIKRDVKTFFQHIKDGDYKTLDGISTSDGVKLVSRTIAAAFSDEYFENAPLPKDSERFTKALYNQMKKFDVTVGTPIISEDGNNAEIPINISCICYADFLQALQVAANQMDTDTEYSDKVHKNIADAYTVKIDVITYDLISTYFFEKYLSNQLKRFNEYYLKLSLHNEGSYWAVCDCDDLSKLMGALTMGISGYEKGKIITRDSPDNTNKVTDTFDINIFY